MTKVHTVSIDREIGPIHEGDQVNGVAFDGERIWYATGQTILALDAETDAPVDHIDVPADAGTAFDGTFLYQLAESKIRKIDPKTREVVKTIPAPVGGNSSGMAWAEGSLWIGQYREGLIHRVDPENGDVLSTIRSQRFVTGVTWADGSLWHGVEGEASYELRRLDHETGAVEERAVLEPGITVSGVAADGRGGFYCGGGRQGKIRHVVVGKPAGR